MQRTTLAASTLGLALAARLSLRASTADHGALGNGPPSASPDTPPAGFDSTAAAQIADDLNLLAQGDWDAEDEAMLADEMMLAETLAEYE